MMVKQKNVPLGHEKRTAAGLKSMRKTTTQFIGVSKEVIMSAGAVCTPWLLMLSGVGPKVYTAFSLYICIYIYIYTYRYM